MTDLAKHSKMANAIRALAMDAVEAAKSGHPGMPMGAADIATVLFTRCMKFDPHNPHWADRDRFVLSAGHGSMLLYSVLHLLGYDDFPLSQLKAFRQIGSRTAGHPEFGHGAGIETTTGPLGQGLATAVGMALAERIMNTTYGDDLVDHHTYVLAGDGCLMEGISQEAIGLAGHLKLSKLIVLWDDNEITIDGSVSLSDSTNQIERFEASGWETRSVDGHNPDEIFTAIEAAKKADRPTLIACKTTIGYGAPNKAGTSGVHGAPLGADEIAGTRDALDWPHKPFEIPSDVTDAWRIAGLNAAHAHKDWQKRHDAIDTDVSSDFDRRMRGDLPSGFEDAILDYKRELAENHQTVATRKASQMALEVINKAVTETIGGSADLTGSNNTKTAGMTGISAEDFSGRFVNYGIREHGMAAAMNGMALHGGVIPYSGTFLVFADYARPAIRLSALMGQRVVYVMTHDSIGLGEDGPTHQPVEHLASLRAIPNLNVFRPADVTETAECWQLALENQSAPSVIALTRQNLPALRTTFEEKNPCKCGAYVLASTNGHADVTLFASGSEVEIAMEAKSQLEDKDISVRVISVPCFELFEAQSAEFKADIIGQSKIKVAIEAAVRQGWDQFIGSDGLFVGMSGFGASGPYKALYEHFGITADAVTNQVVDALEQASD